MMEKLINLVDNLNKNNNSYSARVLDIARDVNNLSKKINSLAREMNTNLGVEKYTLEAITQLIEIVDQLQE